MAAQRHTTELGAHPLTYTIEWNKPRQARVIAEMVFPVARTQIWTVLTDYDHLEEFIPYLLESQVLQRRSGRLLLRQEGIFWLPFYRLKTEAVMWVEERPHERIFFKAVEGDFSVYEGGWRLEPAKEGTRLTYEVTIELKFWVPPALPIGGLRGLLNRHLLHGDIDAGLIHGTPLDGADRLHRLEALDHLAEDGVFPVQPRRGGQGNEELAAARVGQTDVRHGKNAGGVVL